MGVGGAERILASLATGLPARGFSTLVCCLYEAGPVGEELRGGGVEVVDNVMRSRYDVKGWARLVALLRRRQIDVLYLNNQPATQLWGTFAARAARTPLVVTALHFTARDTGKGRRVNRVTGRFTDLWIAISDVQRRRLIAHEGVPGRGSVAVVPNGVDIARFAAGAAARGQTRAALGVPADHRVVSIVAGLRSEKNHSLFLRAASRIVRERPSTTFLVVGDGECRADLEREALALELGSSVRFLGIRHDVAELMNASDVGVLSSTFGVETSPVTLLEFMSCAKPVVSTDVGAVREIVVEGETGFLVAEEDEEGFAAAITALLRDEELAARIGAAARAHVAANFSLDRMLERTEEELVNAWEKVL